MRSKETSTTVIFVRHAEPDFPKDRIYCDGLEDPGLTHEGVRQAQITAEFFRDMPIGAIYVSPAKRTLCTAKPIAEATGVQAQTVPALVERRFGIWEGLYFNEVETRYPDEYLRWKQDKAGYTPEGGETVHDLLGRLSPALGDIIGRHRGEIVVVVSHVGPIRVCAADAFQMPLALYRQITVDYASLNRIDYGNSQNNLMFLNKTVY